MRVTHATPGPVYSGVPDRDWESVVPEQCRETVPDITTQLVQGEYGQNIRVNKRLDQISVIIEHSDIY